MRDGRLVLLDVEVDFSVTNLANTGSPVADAGATLAGGDLVRLDMHNTSADIIKVYAGKAAASAELVAKIGPSTSRSVKTMISKGQQLYFKSVIGAVSSGRLSIAGYN